MNAGVQGALVVAFAFHASEQRLIEGFRAAGATTPDRACSPRALGLADEIALPRLVERRLLRGVALLLAGLGLLWLS